MKTDLEQLLAMARVDHPADPLSPPVPENFASRIGAMVAARHRRVALVWMRAGVAGVCAAVALAGWSSLRAPTGGAGELAEAWLELDAEEIE
jgi:type VI protein secretion system component VasF